LTWLSVWTICISLSQTPLFIETSAVPMSCC